MKMHNPPHPGEIIKGLWLDPMGVSITPEIAIRLSIALGSSPESWMGHQVTYDLWLAEQHKKVLNAVPLTAA